MVSHSRPKSALQSNKHFEQFKFKRCSHINIDVDKNWPCFRTHHNMTTVLDNSWRRNGPEPRGSFDDGATAVGVENGAKNCRVTEKKEANQREESTIRRKAKATGRVGLSPSPQKSLRSLARSPASLDRRPAAADSSMNAQDWVAAARAYDNRWGDTHLEMEEILLLELGISIIYSPY